MITRIVRMEFAPENAAAFLEIFNASKAKIRAFEGCEHLELHRDAQHPHVFFTYSKWTGDDRLEAYRKSELFADTWARTKALFQAKPLAYSLLHEQTVSDEA